MMPQYKTVLAIGLILVLLAEFAAIMGIFSDSNDPAQTVISARGQEVSLYGKGIYRHMPAEVAPQGIAQDYVTLFIGIPLLLIGLIWAQAGTVRARLMLAGVLAYFLLTYLYWMSMVTYNDLFLIYVILTGLSMFAFLIVMLHLPPRKVKSVFIDPIPRKTAGWFLIIGSAMTAFNWLSLIVPPWVKGSAPRELYHLTTLIVQGMDLAFFLPFAFVSGILLLRKSPWGYLFVPVNLVFLSLLFTALLAKLIYSMLKGISVATPLLVVASVILILAVYLSTRVLKGTRGI